MKSKIQTLVFIFVSITASAQSSGNGGKHAAANYRYYFSSSCNCIISEDNPAGIEEVSVYPYEADPDIHEHNAGYYAKTSKNNVKQFSLVDFNPSDFSCNPCLTFIPEKKYAFMLKGKPGMDDVSVEVYKDAKGMLKAAK